MYFLFQTVEDMVYNLNKTSSYNCVVRLFWLLLSLQICECCSHNQVNHSKGLTGQPCGLTLRITIIKTIIANFRLQVKFEGNRVCSLQSIFICSQLPIDCSRPLFLHQQKRSTIEKFKNLSQVLEMGKHFTEQFIDSHIFVKTQ